MVGTSVQDALRVLAEASEEADRARQQLHDALESISEGVVLFDSDDRIIVCNSIYRDYFAATIGDEVGDLVKPGTSLWDILRAAHARGMFPLIAGEDIEPHIERRKALRKNPGGIIEQYLCDGRWLQINEHRTADGGIASVYTDVTDLKRHERELASKTETLETVSAKLAKYLPPQVYRSIFSGEQDVAIASKRKKLTVFFSDIADFTDTVEALESEELTGLLNLYLTEMSKLALAYGATVDKFIGDAIVAFFGDPVSRGLEDDATACVHMALAMQKRMGELQAAWRERGLEQAFELRIGITTGYCTVGNFGSEDRLHYTAIGNAVNLAARLQALAERGEILIDNETRSLVRDVASIEARGSVKVKGFSRPVHVYAVVPDEPRRGDDGILAIDEEGLQVRLDPGRLNGHAKDRALAALQGAIDRLRAE